MTLCETGTRALLGAVFGITATGELDWVRKLLRLPNQTMLVLADRGSTPRTSSARSLPPRPSSWSG